MAASLALIAGLILIANMASAQAQKTPIAGQYNDCRNLTGCEKWWVDGDGVGHCRNRKYRCMHSGDFVGREIGWDSNTMDQAAGILSGRGALSFSGQYQGEPIQAVGTYTRECSKVEAEWICTRNDVWHLSNGSLLKFSASPYSLNVYPRPYLGIRLAPPGRE